MDNWISVEDRFPGIGQNVIVFTEFMDQGKPANETFIGYLGEDGNLYSLPVDDNYGWSFKECVTFWKQMPSPPNTTIK